MKEVSSSVELAAHVSYGAVQECPDACSANARKKAKTFSELPDNVFGVDGTCGTHQGHRIVESREKDMIGNVHAVFVTCANVGHQNRIQRALQSPPHDP